MLVKELLPRATTANCWMRNDRGAATGHAPGVGSGGWVVREMPYLSGGCAVELELRAPNLSIGEHKVVGGGAVLGRIATTRLERNHS